MPTQVRASVEPGADGSDQDQALVEDVRRLGKMLGDTIRDQDGEAMFELVERSAG